MKHTTKKPALSKAQKRKYLSLEKIFGSVHTLHPEMTSEERDAEIREERAEHLYKKYNRNCKE